MTSRPALLLTAFAVLVSVAEAADKTWDGTTGSYTIATNWAGDVLPVPADNVIVSNGGTIQILAGNPTWQVNDVRAGTVAGATGTFQQQASTVQLNSWFRLGLVAGGTGRYSLQGGALRMHTSAGGHVHIGEAGTGILEITGGSMTVSNSNHIILGDRDAGDLGSATSTGTVLQSGGTFSSGNEMWIGQGGLGAGTLAGSYNLSGTGALTLTNWLAIGRSGSKGEMNISGGTFSKSGSGNVILGHAGGTGTITQTGGTVTNTTNTWFGESGGTGTWTISGSAVANLGLIELAYSPTSNGTINLDGGVLSTSLVDAVSLGAAVMNLNGGVLKATGDQRFFVSELVDALNVKAGGAIIDTGTFSVGIQRGLTDAGGGGGLTKRGTGILSLSGVSSFSGAADVAAGNLELSGMLAQTPSATPVASAFSGTIGTLTTGALSFTTGSVLEAQIDSGRLLADRVAVNGNVALGGAQLTLADLGSTTLEAGAKLTLLTYTGTLSGVFSNAADGALIVAGANRFTISYHDSNAVTLVVPVDGVGAAYANWAKAKGLTGANSASSADPDGDGLTNLAEFATGGDPLSSTANPSVVSGLADASGTTAFTLTLPVRDGAVFSGTAGLQSAPVDGVIYRIEGSTDLIDFSGLAVTELSSASSGNLPTLPVGWSYRTFRAPGVPGNPDSRAFLRFSIADAFTAP